MLERLPEPAVALVLERILGLDASGASGASGSCADLGVAHCCHFKLARLTCKYVRGVSCFVDVPLRVSLQSLQPSPQSPQSQLSQLSQLSHAGIRAARAVFPRSTSVAVTSAAVTSEHEVTGVAFAFAVDPDSLRGIRHVRLETAMTTMNSLGASGASEIEVPALDAERLVVGVSRDGQSPLARVVFASRGTHTHTSASPWPNLRDLELRSTTLDERGVERIAGLRALRTLRVSLSRVTLGAFGALGALSLTALDVSGFRTIPKLEIPTLERLRARFTAMHPGALSALTSLTFLDVRSAISTDYRGARSHRLVYLDIGNAFLPLADRECAAMPVEVCLCDGAHWRVGPCAAGAAAAAATAALSELASSHISLVTTLCLDRSLERAL